MDIPDNIMDELLKSCGVIVKQQDKIKIYDIIKAEIETKTQDVINKAILIKSKKSLTMNDINKLHQINEEYIV
jgi:hypothetical protein